MNKKNVKVGELRKLVRETVMGAKLNEETVSPPVDVVGNSTGTIAAAPGGKQLSMPETAIALTKAAHVGLKAVESLKSKSMPTSKAANAISQQINILEKILNDIWQNPVAYLDKSPDAVLSDHDAEIEKRYTSKE
jgi:delta-aminolevulinic acid dehydratase/porphobilinogen synthase